MTRLRSQESYAGQPSRCRDGIEQRLVVAGAFLILAATAITSWWAFLDRSTPITVTEQSVKEPKVIRQGGWFILHRAFCIAWPTRLEIEQSLDGGIKYGAVIHLLPPYGLRGATGCHEQDVQIDLPLYIPAGDYSYDSAVLFRRNPIQGAVQLPLPPVEFHIWPR